MYERVQIRKFSTLIIGRLTKQNVILFSDSITMWEIPKKIWDLEGLPLAPSKWLWPLSKWKKNCSDYRVDGIQTDRLGLTVSTQKSVLKNMHQVPRYRPKCVKFCWFGLEGPFWTLFWPMPAKMIIATKCKYLLI